MSMEVNGQRVLTSIQTLGKIGAIDGGGVCRLALTDADFEGRQKVIEWMKELGLEIRVDSIGNVVGRYLGCDPELPAIMMGSHIDTVRTGGLLDGNLGVLAGLEIVRCFVEADFRPERSIEVGFFTNEEGSRFSPDMMGSLVYMGKLALGDALAVRDADGISVAEELERLGLVGDAAVPGVLPHCFLELHIEQGPVLDKEGCAVGAVHSVQGISWQKLRIAGQSNHAGTTPMSMRRDAGLAAFRIASGVRELVTQLGGDMVGTVGHITLGPNLINVVPNHVEMTVDLRSPVSSQLQEAEVLFEALFRTICAEENVEVERERLVQLDPVEFDLELVERIEMAAKNRGLRCRRMVSGAGHDAQIFAEAVPAGMIFVPSIGGISHNVTESTADADVVAGCQLLLDIVLELASVSSASPDKK